MGVSEYHILIVNQHGDNRGDEAAMRAMVNAFVDRLGNVRFTILHQFRDRELRPSLSAPVEWYSLVLSPIQALHLTALASARYLGLGRSPAGSSTASRICAAYESADLVVSAPGGPYFGDIYASHELVHWYFVWLAGLFHRRVFLYAPSVGPFLNRFLNPVRKLLFRRFDGVCVREEVSASYLREFLPDLHVTVTADSALQREPMPRGKPDGKSEDKLMVAVSAREHQFPNASDASARQYKKEQYLNVLEAAIAHIAAIQPARFLLFPQLYGSRHSDVEFLRAISRRLPDGFDFEIIDPDSDADEQQNLFAQADLCIASRYHPQIFAAAAGVPGICISYEHKMMGFMHRIGLERFAFPIDELDKNAILTVLDEIIANRTALRDHLLRETAKLREVSARTTDLAIELIPSRVADPLLT
jgi:colanic acid/amylovoran biosynthesis protein